MTKVKVIKVNGDEMVYDVTYTNAYIATIMECQNDDIQARIKMNDGSNIIKQSSVKEIYADGILMAELKGWTLCLVPKTVYKGSLPFPKCECIDCGGQEDKHSNDCEYMNDVFSNAPVWVTDTTIGNYKIKFEILRKEQS